MELGVVVLLLAVRVVFGCWSGAGCCGGAAAESHGGTVWCCSGIAGCCRGPAGCQGGTVGVVVVLLNVTVALLGVAAMLLGVTVAYGGGGCSHLRSTAPAPVPALHSSDV